MGQCDIIRGKCFQTPYRGDESRNSKILECRTSETEGKADPLAGRATARGTGRALVARLGTQRGTGKDMVS
jgi:hypothetical protein